MTRQGAAARRREQQGLPEAKPGRVGWVHGTKLTFMTSYKDAFVKATELGKVQAGRFYDDVTDAYLKKYGYKMTFGDDLREDQNVASDVDEDEDPDSVPTEVGEARATYCAQLRSKIGSWFRTEYGASTKTKKSKKVTFKEIFDKEELAPPRPVRPRVTHFYSARCYNERIKPRFDSRWAAVSKLANPPAPITVQNQVTKEAWDAESDPFKNEILAALENEHKAAVEAYEIAVSGEEPKTPEDFQIALDNAAFYLQPFINVVADRFGMNASLVMCRPVPNRGGAIEIHSVHAGMSKGMVPRIWPDFDRAGFEAMRRSFRAFSEECFTMEERRARSLSGMPEMTAPPEFDLGESPPSIDGADSSHSTIDAGARDNEEENAGNDKDDNEDEEDDDEPLRDPKTALEPDLAAEVAKMDAADRARFLIRVQYTMSDSELLRENNMARNRRLARDIVGPGFFSVQSDTSRAAAAGEKRKAEEVKAKEIGKKRKQQVGDTNPTSPRRTRGRALEERDARQGSEAGDEAPPANPNSARPRPKPAYKGAEPNATNVPLVRPEEDSAAPAPLLPTDNEGGGAIVLLVRPEDDSASQGPLLPPNATSVPLVRPEEDSAAEGPQLPTLPRSAQTENEGEGAIVPLVRPEDDSASQGPLLPIIPRSAQTENEGGGGAETKKDVWVGEDVAEWDDELRKAVRGFVRLQEWGGSDWIECVHRLIAFERVWGFPAKGLLSAPPEGRPGEIKGFMRYRRKWETSVELENATIGPRDLEGSFASGWWAWWRSLQPQARRSADGVLSRPEGLRAEVWEDLAKTHGRNGMLLVVGCLLWWGDTAAASEQALLLEDWKKAVEDVGWVLGESTKGVKALYVTAFDVSTALANFGDSVKRLGEAESKAAKVIKENKKKAMEEDAGKATRGTVKRKASSSMEKENAEVERPRFAESGFLPLRTDPPLRKRKRATR